MELVERNRHAREPEEQEELKRALAEVVEKHFQVRQERRELELRHLEQQLDRLREAIKKRAESRELIIRQRISQLLGDNDLSF
jgi:septum formation topological specificity factor MinE